MIAWRSLEFIIFTPQKEIQVNSGAHFTGTGIKKHTGIPVTETETGIPVGPYW